ERLGGFRLSVAHRKDARPYRFGDEGTGVNAEAERQGHELWRQCEPAAEIEPVENRWLDRHDRPAQEPDDDNERGDDGERRQEDGEPLARRLQPPPGPAPDSDGDGEADEEGHDDPAELAVHDRPRNKEATL